MERQPSHLIERAAKRTVGREGAAAGLLDEQPGFSPPPAPERPPAVLTSQDPALQGLASDIAIPAMRPQVMEQPAKAVSAGADVAPSGRAGVQELPDDIAIPVMQLQAPAAPAPLAAPASISAATLRRAGMMDWANTRERLSEEFRIVQGQVLQAVAGTTARSTAFTNLVMLTSAKPGEGKSFSALNLAGSLASCSHKPVILVDMDPQRCTLSTNLDLLAQPGLLDLAYDSRRPMADVLIGTALPNLRVLPAGQPRPDMPSGGKPIVTALERLCRAHRECLIVLDTPPCLSSSYPSMLAPSVGQVVMLVEAQRTQRAELESALDLIDACPTVMLLLNKVQMTASDTFGAYGY